MMSQAPLRSPAPRSEPAISMILARLKPTKTLKKGCATLLSVVVLFTVSCNESPTGNPEILAIGDLQLSVVSGDDQSGPPGEELPDPLVVLVETPEGKPVQGQIVNFRVVAGGGSVFAGAALTNSEGIARERWTLGEEGAQRVEARAVDTETGEPLVFAVFRATVEVLAITPSSSAVAPGSPLVFTGLGGRPPYSFSFVQNNSLGTLTDDGLYTAGFVGGVTDIVRVTDARDATADATVSLGPSLALDPRHVSVPPNTASGDLVATGGAPPYAFSCDEAGVTLYCRYGVLSVPSGNAVRYYAGAEGPGTDRVWVTDANGAKAYATVDVGQPLGLRPLEPLSVAPLGSIDFEGVGGTGSYQFQAYEMNSGGTIDEATGLYSAGPIGGVTDIVSVNDGTSFATASVTVLPALSIVPANASVVPLGSLSFFATHGGAPPYTYTLVQNNSLATIVGDEYTAGRVGNVTDVVRVTDANGAMADATVSVGSAVAITPTTASVAPLGSTGFEAVGGDGFYTFSLVQNNSDATLDQTTGLYTAGPVGNVIDVVRVADGNGGFAEATVSVGPALSLAPASASVDPLGGIEFFASGGNGSYAFSFDLNISGGTINPSTGQYTAGSVGGGADIVRVTDGLGSTVTATVTVGSALTVSPVTASVAPLGSVQFVAGGGVGNYTFSLFQDNSGGSIDHKTGLYTAGSVGQVTDIVRVTDADGNRAEATVELWCSVWIFPTGDATVGSGAQAVFNPECGQPPYSFSIRKNRSGATLVDDPNTIVYVAGPTSGVTDVVRITDFYGAFAQKNIHVTPSLAITPSTVSVRPGDIIDFSATGGGLEYNFYLVQKGSGATIDSSTGTYTAGPSSGVDVVRVTDEWGATADATVTVAP